MRTMENMNMLRKAVELLVWVLQGLKFKDGFAPHPTIFSQHKGFFEVSKKGTWNKRGFWWNSLGAKILIPFFEDPSPSPGHMGFCRNLFFLGAFFVTVSRSKPFQEAKVNQEANMWIQLAKEFQCHPSCHCRINPKSSSIKSSQSFILLPFNCHGAIDGNKRNQSDC